MEKETEYAERLIERYQLYALTEYNAIHCAIKDVENTIEAMSQMKLIFSDRELILKYYQTVLQILKDKL